MKIISITVENSEYWDKEIEIHKIDSKGIHFTINSIPSTPDTKVTPLKTKKLSKVNEIQ